MPGKILDASGEDLERSGRVNFGGIVKRVSLAYVPEARVGDFVIVHVGFAISVVDAEEAERTFRYLQEIEDLSEIREDSR